MKIKIASYILSAAIIVTTLLYVYHTGKKHERQKCVLELQAQKIDTLDKVVKNQEVVREIRNNRPDLDTVIKRLQRGEF